MKLVEILAREMSKWPFEGYEGYAEQDHDREVRFMKCGTSQKDFFASNLAEEDEKHSCSDGIPYAGPVTRADWEAERARIKGEKAMPKANKDGWIRHRGGRQPVLDDVRVDYRTRDGDIDETGFKAGVLHWGHIGGCADIMAWRPHKAEQVIVSDASVLNDGLREPEMPAAKYFDGPLQWRDRIQAIGFDKAAAQKAHEAAIAALDSERAELVAKLKAEGLALVQAEVDSHQEDMSDPANWKAGDMVESLEEEEDISKGGIYKIIEIGGGDIAFRDNAGDRRCRDAEDYKWHSRPSC